MQFTENRSSKWVLQIWDTFRDCQLDFCVRGELSPWQVASCARCRKPGLGRVCIHLSTPFLLKGNASQYENKISSWSTGNACIQTRKRCNCVSPFCCWDQNWERRNTSRRQWLVSSINLSWDQENYFLVYTTSSLTWKGALWLKSVLFGNFWMDWLFSFDLKDPLFPWTRMVL